MWVGGCAKLLEQGLVSPHWPEEASATCSSLGARASGSLVGQTHHWDDFLLSAKVTAVVGGEHISGLRHLCDLWRVTSLLCALVSSLGI